MKTIMIRRFFRATLLALAAMGALGCLATEEEVEMEVALAAQALQIAEGDAVLRPSADTYVSELLPTVNFGKTTNLLVAGVPFNGFKHSLLKLDDNALVFAVGGRSILSARLVMPVESVVTPGTVGVHRMKQAWSETGANWLCSQQTGLLCPFGKGWNMFTTLLGAPYVTSATDTEPVSFVSSELVFDVTSDVRAFVNGTAANHGWLFKKGTGSVGVVASFRSKDVTQGPTPYLTLQLGNPPDPTQAQACRDALVRDPALSDAEANRKYQRQWIACGGPEISTCMAALLADHNIDYTRAATELFHGTFSPAQYLAVSRDRTRKRFIAQDDPTWACSYVAGDADSDRVPNDRDKCPGTPQLTQTDDVGCPVTTLPNAPDADQVHDILDNTGIVVTPPGACDGMTPQMPDILDLRRLAISAIGPSGEVSFAFTEAHVAVSPVSAPKPECVVWYQFQAAVPGYVFDDGEERIYQLALQENDADGAGPGMLYFFIESDDPASLGAFASLRPISRFPPGGPLTQIRVRAVYANGAASPWSKYKTFQ